MGDQEDQGSQLGGKAASDAASKRNGVEANDEGDSKPVKDTKGKRGGRRKKKEPETAGEGFASLAVKSRALRIAAQLDEMYPNPLVPLDNASSYQLLVACMLSARTTDKAVNKQTPALFEAAPDAESMAKLEVPTILGYINKIGLAPTKAKNLQGLSKMLVEKHGGEVPDNFQDLESLPGVGHKTASVVMAQAFGKPAFPVDTHIHRLAERWGLSDGSRVTKTESDLKALFPEETWNKLHLQIIYFGREHCPAMRHKPEECPICSWVGKVQASKGKKAAGSKAKESEAEKPVQKKKRGKRAATKDGDAAQPRRSRRKT